MLQSVEPSRTPKALTKEDLDLLAESCLEERIISVKQRKENLELDAGRSTINAALIGMGFKAYRSPKKPFLYEGHIERRLDFALQHEHWTDLDWKSVVFTDESSIRVVNASRRTLVRRTEEEAWHEDAFQPYVSQCDSVMVLGGGGGGKHLCREDHLFLL